MPVAEQPGGSRQHSRIGNAGLDQRFGIGHDLDQAPVIEHQRVVGRESGRLGEIEFDAGALAGEEESLLGLALIEIENEIVGGGARTRFARPQDLDGARHDDPYLTQFRRVGRTSSGAGVGG